MKTIKFALLFCLWEALRFLSFLKLYPKQKVFDSSPVECDRCGWIGPQSNLINPCTEEGASCPSCGASGWYLQTPN